MVEEGNNPADNSHNDSVSAALDLPLMQDETVSSDGVGNSEVATAEDDQKGHNVDVAVGTSSAGTTTLKQPDVGLDIQSSHSTSSDHPPSDPSSIKSSPSVPSLSGGVSSAAPASHPSPNRVRTTTTNLAGSGAAATTTKTPSLTPDQVRDELRGWLHTKLNNEDSSQLQILLNDYDVLKDKTVKLKSLLGRSAKAQREVKVELDATQKRLEVSLREIDKLNRKIDQLATRPTHMELLADFESNFDRALLQIGQQQHHNHPHYQQAGGQDTASLPLGSSSNQGDGNTGAAFSSSLSQDTSNAVVDGLLLQELSDAKSRLDKLEQLNAALLHRSSQLEAQAFERQRERDELGQRLSHVELEKRMATIEAEQALKAKRDVEASLIEMQMEIDLLTKASVTANTRAAHGEQALHAIKTDQQRVQQLESQVQALQEWALASSEAKSLAQERVRLLETQLRALQHPQRQTESEGGSTPSSPSAVRNERTLLMKSASLVVGAGDAVARVIQLTSDQVRSVKLSERVLLRWQFDLTQEDATIEFSLLQSDCDTPAKRKTGRHLIRDRFVKGGAAGEVENAFILDNACTLCWSNAKSWVRPKTVKYTVEAIVVPY